MISTPSFSPNTSQHQGYNIFPGWYVRGVLPQPKLQEFSVKPHQFAPVNHPARFTYPVDKMCIPVSQVYPPKTDPCVNMFLCGYPVGNHPAVPHAAPRPDADQFLPDANQPNNVALRRCPNNRFVTHLSFDWRLCYSPAITGHHQPSPAKHRRIVISPPWWGSVAWCPSRSSFGALGPSLGSSPAWRSCSAMRLVVVSICIKF